MQLIHNTKNSFVDESRKTEIENKERNEKIDNCLRDISILKSEFLKIPEKVFNK